MTAPAAFSWFLSLQRALRRDSVAPEVSSEAPVVPLFIPWSPRIVGHSGAGRSSGFFSLSSAELRGWLLQIAPGRDLLYNFFLTEVENPRGSSQ